MHFFLFVLKYIPLCHLLIIQVTKKDFQNMVLEKEFPHQMEKKF